MEGIIIISNSALFAHQFRCDAAGLPVIHQGKDTRFSPK
jgi:hypothetical protein